MVDASERLQVLLQQESTYRTSDYLTRMQLQAATEEEELMDNPEENLQPQHQQPSGSKKRSTCSSSLPESPKPPKRLNSGSEGCTGAAKNGSGASASASSNQINKHWREKICEWAYQVIDHFDLHRECVSIAMSHLDRYLANYSDLVDKNQFQLLAMTCLYMAIKLNEYKHLMIPGSKSSMETILHLSKGFFTIQQMEKMEYDVLQRLQWHVHPPTPQVFVKHFMLFLISHDCEERDLHDLAQFYVELSAMDYFFVDYKASDVALASLLNAMETASTSTSQETTLQLPFQDEAVDLESTSIRACRERLSLIHAQATGTTTPKRSEDIERRTTSPVSVMEETP